jgi:hypothetical protein
MNHTYWQGPGSAKKIYVADAQSFRNEMAFINGHKDVPAAAEDGHNCQGVQMLVDGMYVLYGYWDGSPVSRVVSWVMFRATGPIIVALMPLCLLALRSWGIGGGLCMNRNLLKRVRARLR